MGSPGYIYALTNESMPGLYKIGLTTRTVEERVAEISSATGVPTPFTIFCRKHVSDCNAAERMVHEYFQQRGKRENSSREFFRVTSDEVLQSFAQAEKAFPFVAAPSAQPHAPKVEHGPGPPLRSPYNTPIRPPKPTYSAPPRPRPMPQPRRQPRRSGVGRAMALTALTAAGVIYVQIRNPQLDLPWRRALPVAIATAASNRAPVVATRAVAVTSTPAPLAVEHTKVPLALSEGQALAAQSSLLDRHDREARATASAQAAPEPTRTPRGPATTAVPLPRPTRAPATVAPTRTPAAPPTIKAAAGPARGERIPMGEYAITVLDVEEAGGSYTPTYALPAGKKLVAVKVRIETNEWQVFHTVASQRATLSAGGRRYPLAKYGAKSPSFNEPFDARGKDSTGWLTFEVDAAASGYVLIYQASDSASVSIVVGR